MKVHDPKVVATQPDPVSTHRVIDNVNVVVFEADINRPKRPELWTALMNDGGGNWNVQVHCFASEGTPADHRDEKVMFDFEVTDCENLQVIQDSGRYIVNLVFIDRGETT